MDERGYAGNGGIEGPRRGAAPHRGPRNVLTVAAVAIVAIPVLVLGGCVYSCAFVPSSPLDQPMSVSMVLDAHPGEVPANAEWRDTIAEADSAAEGGQDVLVVEDYPDSGEALVVQPSGSPKCPAIRMDKYVYEEGRYAVTGFWGASQAQPGKRTSPIEPLYDYTTAEVAANSLSSCLSMDSHVAFGVSMDPSVHDLTIGGVSPTWVREIDLDGEACYVWCYEDMDVRAMFYAAGMDASDFTLREVIDGLDIRVGDEAPY
ncbi:hypothetical protein [Slackia heliotrinireducens]|uniref:hypothetical protein n=1 Tax=Slackia heliotrinireducens TaxID=84110 RepID=UPI00331539A7